MRLCCCRISGVVNTGEHLASEPLTAALHMLDLRPHQPHLMHSLALACRSVRETAQALCNGYADGSLQSMEASELPYPLWCVMMHLILQPECVSTRGPCGPTYYSGVLSLPLIPSAS